MRTGNNKRVLRVSPPDAIAPSRSCSFAGALFELLPVATGIMVGGLAAACAVFGARNLARDCGETNGAAALSALSLYRVADPVAGSISTYTSVAFTDRKPIPLTELAKSKFIRSTTSQPDCGD